MKKFVLLFLACFLALMPLLTLSACNNKTDEQPNTDLEDQPGDDPAPAEQLVLVADGVSQYRIVRSDFANATVKSITLALRDAIEAATGVKPALISDYEDEDNNADIKEILVGKTNRPESSALISRLQSGEYGYEVNGNKIVLAGVSDALLDAAVASFLSTYLGYHSENNYVMKDTFSIPKDLSVVRSNDHSQDIALYSFKDVNYLDELHAALSSVTSSVTLMSVNDAVENVFDLNKFGLVVFAGADTAPTEAKSAVNNYLNAGGRVLFLGGPTFEKEITLYDWKGERLTAAEYAQAVLDAVDTDDATLMLDTTKQSTIGSMYRTTNDESTPYKVSVGNYGLSGSSAQLYHEISLVTNWDMLAYNVPSAGRGNNLIILQAKPGNEDTPHFTFEIWEQDGTRWYANVIFESDDWMTYMFSEESFTYFQGPGASRGTPDFDNIKKIQIGYASSFYGIPDNKLAYYLSEPILCQMDDVVVARPNSTELILDTIAPLYEQYPITNAAHIITEDEQAYITERDYVVPSSLFSCHSGRQGNGFDKGSAARFIPLLRVTDEKGLHSGYAAWIQLFSSANSANGDLERAMIGCFSASSDDFYNADGIAAVAEAAQAMIGNAFIIDGGAENFLYVDAETSSVIYGINYLMTNGNTANISLQVSLYKDNKLLDRIESAVASSVASASGIRTTKAKYDLSDGKPDRAEAVLLKDGKVIDRVAHTIRFWTPKPIDELSFVYVEDGYFKRDGKIVSFFGVNYLPSYNTANYPAENVSGAYYNLYCADPAYDPEVISYDLAHIKDLGMNAISFSCNGVTNNLLDLILQCEEAGLYIDLSINGRGAFPLKDFSADGAISTITTHYLDHIDSIIAYDVAWEPRIGAYEDSNYIGRKHWDDEFTAWVKVQYGSIDAAEAAWGTKAERNAQGHLVVSDDILNATGTKYQKLVAAYYRFLDDQISKEMAQISNITDTISNQMFSFRMSMAGSALRTDSFKPSTHCFDFQSLASSMSFMQPEGYQLTANTGVISADSALQITFANAYARYTQPDSPVVWKEFGKHVWTGGDLGNFLPKTAQQNAAATYYKYVLEYCYESYTSGMFCWFYSGGYRVGEKSDYGILNPDGSDRPLTAHLREYAPKFINQGERKNSDTVYITVERDDYVGGLFGMFSSVKNQLKSAHESGKAVVFINETQTASGGYAYADTLLNYAVGDAKTANGTYPLRYVNGLVKDLETYTEGGKTYAKITVCNTKQSTWRAGSVSLVSAGSSAVNVRSVINQEVGYLEDVTLTIPLTGRGKIELRFEIAGVQFGPLFSSTIK